MKRPTPYSPPFPLFLFLFLLLLLFLPCHPFFFLPLLFPLSFLFLSLPLPFSSSPSLPPRHRHFTPLFVTPFFCCGSSISFQHEPAHFSNTKDCDPVYRIPFRRLDTTLRLISHFKDQLSTLHNICMTDGKNPSTVFRSTKPTSRICSLAKDSRPAS